MQRAALYIRVSTQEQALHGLSVGVQEANLQEWAKQNGIRVVGVYKDEGVSARKSAAKRPALQRLLEDVQAGKIDLILFTKLDRWFRNVGEYYKVQEILEKHHVNWRTIQEDYDTSTTSGRFKINIMLSVAQDEADRTSDRIKVVMQAKRERGESVGTLPKGYKREGKQIVIDEEVAPLVRAAFEMYLSTASISKVIKAFPELKLNYLSARYMFDSSSYAGDMKGIPIPAIITQEQHERAKATRKTIVRKTKENRVYLFSGLLFCPECGNRLTGRQYHRQKYPYYQCPKAQSFGACQHRKMYREDRIEAYLLDHIEDKVMELTSEQEQPVSHKAQRDAVKKKLSRLSELYVAEMIDMSDYKRQYNELSAELATIPEDEPPIDLERMRRHIAEGWRERYDTLTREEKQAFWRETVKAIYLSADLVRDFSLR